ncbi:MAG TPA: thiolase family protein [Anaerolineales bacterium]
MNDKGREPVILGAARTPIGRFRGMLRDLPATELGALVVREAVRRAGLAEGSQIDEVLMGNVVAAGLGQAPARQAAIQAGLPPTVGATTVNKVCGSGLKAGMFASQAIKAGDAEVVVAGGMESMSRAPFLVRGRGGELNYGHRTLEDSLLLDGLWDPFQQWAMGMAAEFIADEYEVTREAMDRWALDSHRKAAAAQDAGKFESEIVPIEVPGEDGKARLEVRDETLRRDSSLERLAALKPVFRSDGRVTAGNSPGLNDGAAAVVYASREKAAALGLRPIARVVGYAQAAVAPKQMFIAPAQAIPALLTKVGWSPEQVDLIELNEAFAAQVLADGYALSETGWDWEKVNVHGGAIALGHPLGASGARILTTLIYALQDRGLSRGLASLCLGGGEAVAMAIELE